MRRVFWCCVLLISALLPVFVQAQELEHSERSLPLIGGANSDGTAIKLDLSRAKEPRVGNVSVSRRVLGETGADSWKVIAPSLGPVLKYVDDTTLPGTAYEYRVTRSAKDIVDIGYFAAGALLPAIESRGKALVIVDATLFEDIKPRLSRFARDLTGDGWEVVMQTAARDDAKEPLQTLELADQVRRWIMTQYQADPFAPHSIILVGRLPYVMSGQVRPDGHGAQPHPTDLFYAELDGQWRLFQTPDGALTVGENRLPTDFIEAHVGRIDFSPQSPNDRDKEIGLLRAYFDKNHHWRNAHIGDLREAYGDAVHLRIENDSLLNIVGADSLAEGGHHDIGEEKPWLWGIDFGHFDGSQYEDSYENKAVFVMNFGSGKQLIHSPKNALTASLAQPWYTLAVGWGGRPSWRLHHMALGGTIGEAHLRTVNNGRAGAPYRDSLDYYPTGAYLWRNPIWVNLLGDPTLRAFMLAPPQTASAIRDGKTVRLSWTASPDADTQGYRVYRARVGQVGFEKIADLGQDARDFTDETAPQDARYMIRAEGLKKVAAGSFYTLSQGVFIVPDAPVLVAPELRADGLAGAQITLPLTVLKPENGLMQAPIEGAAHGRLSVEDGRWVYTPSEGFTGKEVLRYTSATDTVTAEGRITIDVK